MHHCMGQRIMRSYEQLDRGLHMEICQQRHSYTVNVSNKMHRAERNMFSASCMILLFYKSMTAIRHVAASCEVWAL